MSREKKMMNLLELLDIPITSVTELQKAFYHSSYINEHRKNIRIESNERLEFLGDGVLNLIIATYLYERYPHLPEGELTKKRAMLVREEALIFYADVIELPFFLYLGKGEEKSGGRSRPAVIADAFEAFIGSIYLLHGFDKAKQTLLKIINKVDNNKLLAETNDYKSAFQEFVQMEPNRVIQYIVEQEEGPPHNRLYTIAVYVDEIKYGVGIGKSKKEAEQKAAYAAMKKMAR